MVVLRVEAPVHPPVTAPQGRLQIHVIFTTQKATQSALAVARAHAQDLDATLALLYMRVVPYPLAMDNPPVPLAFTEKRLCEITGSPSIDTAVTVYLCRDRVDAIRAALAHNSLIVLGVSNRWWWGRDRRLARLLRREGHQVIVVDKHSGIAGPH